MTPTYQGSYDDSLNKLKAGLQSKDIPAVVQLFDIGTRLMIDLKVATPVQDFIDKEKYDISDLETNVLAYYSVDGKLWSMPFNTSNPMLYYNKDMFKAAGLDPDKPPRTWAEFEDAARKLTQKDASGKVTIPGATFAIYGWFFEQLRRGFGRLLCRQRERPRCAGHQGRLQRSRRRGRPRVVEEDGRRGHHGQPRPQDRGHPQRLHGQQTAMIIESTATLRGMIDSSQGKFEIGTAFLPRPNEEAYNKSGTIIGGASVWILNGPA